MKCTVPSKLRGLARGSARRRAASSCARHGRRRACGRRARAVAELVGLDDRQAVHIGPQPDRARRVADPQPADEPGLADAAMHLDAELVELVGDEVGGALSPRSRARDGRGCRAATAVSVVVKLADAVDGRHVGSPRGCAHHNAAGQRGGEGVEARPPPARRSPAPPPRSSLSRSPTRRPIEAADPGERHEARRDQPIRAGHAEEHGVRPARVAA